MQPRQIAVGLSYMCEPEFNRAILPLLEGGEVEALEWSFDTVRDPSLLPGWQRDLLLAFAREGRLYGHGVYYSLLDARPGDRHLDWLRRLESVQAAFRFRHLSEHFGFMSAGNAHTGCPLPLPLTVATLRLGRQRLRALAVAARCPVGVENLALAFSAADVRLHGPFLRQLVEPAGAFIVLDLHNIYCQAQNFGMSMQELICSYPLDRVREIHLSGGSWAAAGSGKAIRRDTHDDSVPADVLQALSFAIAHCPNLDLVILERLGDTLRDAAGEAAFGDEFLQVKAIVRSAAAGRLVPEWPFAPAAAEPEPEPELADGDPALRRQQGAVLQALSRCPDAASVKRRLQAEPLLSGWNIADWDPDMVRTAMELGSKWGIQPPGEGER